MIEIPEAAKSGIEELVKLGRMLSAWEMARPFGRLDQWLPGPDLSLAASVASGAGDERLSSALDWKNWRADRQQHHYFHQALFARLPWKPPVLLLPEISGRLDRCGGVMTDDERSDILAFKAWALGTLRDFSSATKAINEALAITPQRAWTHVQHACLLEMRDHFEDSLDAARRALALRPVYRPAVMRVVESLVNLGLDDEAVQLLLDTHQRTENGSYAIRLQVIYSEREDHCNALWCLDQAEPLMPLMPKSVREWFAGRRADFLYMAGDIEGCLEWSGRAPELGFQRLTAEKLRRPGARARLRKRLDVPFTRQHSMTCAPATLASLAKYWNQEHNHLEIAKAICHEGTPWHKERAWAVSNGFIAREFRFTRDVLVDLIGRGVPFTLTTSWINGAHLQACIGYDDCKEVALLRDPTHRHFGEAVIDSLIADHPVQGPRCMLLLPHDEEHRLDGLYLPDEALYDAQHELAVALDNHDRWAAQAAVSTMRAINPDHPLTQYCEASLAGYLGHNEKKRLLLAALAEQFPNHQQSQFELLVACQMADDPATAKQLLETMAGRKRSDPAFVSEFGEWLLADARQLPLAGYFLRRAVRMRRGDSRAIESLARYAVKNGDFGEAARLRRFASTLSPNWEPYAMAFFDSHRMMGRTQDALDFLRERIDLVAGKFAGPWLTLAQAMDSIHRDQEARAILEEAITCMPDEGDLKLHAGRMMIQWGGESRELGLVWMDQARGKVAETAWLRARAGAAEFLGDRSLARQLWKSLIVTQPQALDAHRSLAMLIAEDDGRQAAIDFINGAAQHNPRLPGFWILLADWTSGGEPGAALPALDQVLMLDPDDAWALRERAGSRFEAGLEGPALEDAREAIARSPRAPESHGVLASLLQRSGDNAGALAALRDALRHRIDYTFGIESLVGWSPDPAAAREAVAFIEDEMRRQVLTGYSVLDYQRVAAPILSQEALLDHLRVICVERPDLWQSWSARIYQCLAMDLQPEARQCAGQLIKSFPLLPRTWVDVARLERAAGDQASEAAALQRAVELSPAWDWAARQLGDVLERLGRYDEARAMLELAIRHNPLNVANQGCLAHLLHKTGKVDEAYTIMFGAVKTAPLYLWGWQMLARWSKDNKRGEEICALIRELSQHHAHNPEWWYLIADVQASLDRLDDAVAATRKGLEIDPKHINLRDRLAYLLGTLGRFDEAFGICQNDSNKSLPPKEIEGRRAWLLMASGQTLAALQAMETLLEREPEFVWGWELLTYWYAQREDWPMTKTAALQWCRLSPDDATAHGHLGLAAREMGDLETAKRAFERAFRLDPGYAFAGRELFKLQTGKNDLVAAESTLEAISHYVPDEWSKCDAIALALRKGQDSLPAAEALLCSATSLAVLRQLNKLLLGLGPKAASQWIKSIERQIAAGKAVSPAAIACWADLNRNNIPRAVRKLRKFKVPEANRNAGWNILIQALDARKDKDLADKLISRNRKRFKQDPLLWNSVGLLMLNMGECRRAVKWLGDWHERSEGVAPYTLVNLATAIDTVKGPHAAAEVRAEGIRRFPASDDNVIYLIAGQAAYFAGVGRVGEAAKLLELVDDKRISDYYVGLAELARSVIAASAMNEEAARKHYQDALAKHAAWPGDCSVRNYFRPAQKALAGMLPWASGNRRKLTKAWGGLAGRSRLASWLLFAGFVVFAPLIVVAAVGTGTIIPLVIGFILIRALSKKQ